MNHLIDSSRIKRGNFITLEGIDGAGKSSHLTSIVTWLTQRGIVCIETREPGGTHLGEQLRQLILHKNMSSLTELLLLFAARTQHINEVIEPALARGDWVVCDRFTDSTRAYQGGGRNMDMAVIEQLAALLNVNEPDLTVVFDVDLSIASDRIVSRTTQANEPMDKFECAPESFALAVQQAYHKIVVQNPQRCVLIDTNQPLHKVTQQVLQTLEHHFGAF
jgi:dTMP kinase